MELSETYLVYIFGGIAIALVQFGLCKLGLLLAAFSNTSAPVWPATGFAIAALVRGGRRALIPVALGAWAANGSAGVGWGVALSLSIANVVEAWVGSAVYRLLLSRRRSFEIHTWTIITAVACVSGAFPSAVIGLTALGVSGAIPWAQTPPSWFMWFTGNAIGGMLTLPFALDAWKRGQWRALASARALVAVAFLALLAPFIFASDVRDDFAIALFIVLVPMFGLVKGMTGRLGVVILATVAVGATAAGYGPFVSGSIYYRTFGLQVYLGALAVTGLQLEALRRRKVLRIVSPVLVAGFVASATVFYIFSVLGHRKDEARLESLVYASERVLQEKLTIYSDVLRDAAAAVSLEPGVSREKWREYTRRLRVSERLPGASGVGIAVRVPRSEIASFVARTRRDRPEGFEYKTFGRPAGPGDGPEAWIIRNLEPDEIGARALGLDLTTEASRREALESSRDLGSLTMSTQVRLLSDSEHRQGFGFYYPVYRKDLSSDADVATRRAEHLAWIFVPVVSGTFFGNVLHKTDELDFAFYDGDPVSGAPLIFASEGFSAPQFAKHNQFIRLTRLMTVGNRRIYGEWRAGPGFVHAEDGVLAPLGATGALLTLALAWMFANMVTFRSRAERLVAIQTRRIEEDHKRLVDAQKMATLGEMASGIAHEINNPLTIILGRLSVLRGMAGKEIPAAKFIEAIDKLEKPAQRIGKIVRGLRSYMRKGENDPMEPVPVRTILDDTLELVTEKFRKAEVSLTVEGDLDCRISCRATQISQVLLNLIGNSLDAVQGTPGAWVRIVVARLIPDGKATVRFSVIDSGHGIPAEIAQKIMEPFFTTKDVGKGTGLGLSIGKSIVHEHGGELRNDPLHPNTCFTFDLPEAVADTGKVAA